MSLTPLSLQSLTYMLVCDSEGRWPVMRRPYTAKHTNSDIAGPMVPQTCIISRTVSQKKALIPQNRRRSLPSQGWAESKNLGKAEAGNFRRLVATAANG